MGRRVLRLADDINRLLEPSAYRHAHSRILVPMLRSPLRWLNWVERHSVAESCRQSDFLGSQRTGGASRLSWQLTSNHGRRSTFITQDKPFRPNDFSQICQQPNSLTRQWTPKIPYRRCSGIKLFFAPELDFGSTLPCMWETSADVSKLRDTQHHSALVISRSTFQKLARHYIRCSDAIKVTV